MNCTTCGHEAESHLDGLHCCANDADGWCDCPELTLPKAKAKDWAEECAERWAKWLVGDEKRTQEFDAIQAAVREALAKAADVVEKAADENDDDVADLVEEIRALGAAK